MKRNAIIVFMILLTFALSGCDNITSLSTTTSYLLRFLDYDGTLIEERTVVSTNFEDVTDLPTNPSREGYTFSEWEISFDNSANSITATATYLIDTYTVTWKNYDGTILSIDSSAEWGSIPSYSGSKPVKTSTAEYSYSFTGWSPMVSTVTSDREYIAQFNESKNSYIVLWKNYNGTIIKSDTISYGEMPAYNGQTPDREDTAQYNYTFTGWSPAISEVINLQVYTAQFSEEVKTYTITWVDEAGIVLETDEFIEYGTMPDYNSVYPSKENTVEYTYSFAGWSPEVISVTGNQTYVAEFTETKNNYTITFDPEGGDLDNIEIEVEYGTIFDNFPEPRKLGFVFEGWVLNDEDLTYPHMLISDIQLTAVYREMLPHELLWDYYSEVTENTNVVVNVEEGYAELMTGDPTVSAYYFMDGAYGYYFDMSGYEFIIAIDLTTSMLYYEDEYGWFYERDLLYKTYDGNVSMEDYLYIEELFEWLIDSFDSSEILNSVNQIYGKTLLISDFNEHWNELVLLEENHYKTYEMLVMEQIIVYIYDMEVTPFFDEYSVTYYYIIVNNSDEDLYYVDVFFDFQPLRIDGVQSTSDVTKTTFTVPAGSSVTNDYWLITDDGAGYYNPIESIILTVVKIYLD